MLLTVKFMSRVYHGEKSEGVSEWPPSPYRLFQAMVSGVHALQPIPLPRAYDALRRFEALGPPTIYAVPVSDNFPLRMAGKLNQPKAAMLRSVSQVHLQEPMMVQYHWDAPVDDEDMRIVASTIVALGHGLDKTLTWLNNENPDVSLRKWWVNNQVIGNRLRVPVGGSLDDLLHSYAMKVKWPQCPRIVSAFDSQNYICGKPTTTAMFRLEDLNGKNVAFDPQITSLVAAWVRGAACEKRDSFPDGVKAAEVYVAGHCEGMVETQERFAYLPLPSIGHFHSDGYIRRVMVAAGVSDDGSRAAWAARVLNGVRLFDKDGCFQAVMMHDAAGDGVTEQYDRPCRVWRSVTPVVLPWKGGLDRDGVEDVFRKKVFPQAGLDVATFSVRRDPWYLSMPGRGYNIPSYLSKCPMWHVEVELRDGMRGPVMLGAGRFRGLGVMASVV